MTALRTASLAIVLSCISPLAYAQAQASLPGAARLGDAGAVATFLAKGAEVNATDLDGRTALHWAAQRGDAKVVDLLLAAGADAQARDALGRTPLHYAAVGNNTAVLKALLERGADVGAVDTNGDTPLHMAARRFKPDAVVFLISGGAKVNAANSEGQTPLHVLGVAAREDDAALVDLLDSIARVIMVAGGDPALRDNSGQAAWPHEVQASGEDKQPSGYPSYDDIASTLLARANSYPTLCRRVDIGASSTTKRIYALEITSNVGVNADKPEFKYVANMHGDEVVGVVMCLNLIDYLLSNYPTNPRVANIVDNIDVWIIPSVNPYGYTNNTRYNANGYDLNRSFPEGGGTTPEPNTTTGRQPEVATLMNFGYAHSFTLGGNFHGGELVANYPFDNDNKGSTFSPTPDEDLFVFLAETYSQHNTPMWNSTEFTHGITNGADWYMITGGLQDFDYRYMGCNHITFEIGDTKSPAYSTMPTYWSQNQESMLSYLETCLIGVRGIVTDAGTGAPLAATVTVVGRSHPIYTDPQVGDYHRMLLPGTYQLQFTAAGYETRTLPVTVASGNATRLDVPMSPPARVMSPNGGESLYADSSTNVTWLGGPTSQFQVQYSQNYGATGAVTDGFETGMLGSAYTTGGTLPWLVTSGTGLPHAGTYVARSGAISHGQSTWMTRTAAGGAFSFWYRVSSEIGADWFNFYVDGAQVVHRSGNVGWTQYSTTLAAGTHTLKWEYVKDASVNGNADTAYVDDVVLTGDATTWADIIALTPAGATSTPWTPTVVGDAYKVRVRASYGGGSYSSWDESDTIFSVVPAPAYFPGDLNCDGVVNYGDINPFVIALSGQSAYEAAYPGCHYLNADINEDGIVSYGDINPFVELLAT